MTDVLATLLADHVSVERLGDNGQKLTVLHEVSLECKAGEVVVVVGPSGSGKSTLLRLFNRLLEPCRGTIRYKGREIQTLDPPALRRQVVLVAQKPFLFRGSVRDNLNLPSRLNHQASPDFNQPAFREVLDLCRVDPGWLDRDGQRLSLGQQQRICLARALMGECRALLLDEPTSALDRPTAEALASTFRDLAGQRGLALLLVTHDLHLAERCADDLVVLLEGRVVEQGRAAQILKSPQMPLSREFLGRADTVAGDDS